MFAAYLRRWGLAQDGEPIITPTSWLLPVRRGDQLAMLKVAAVCEERVGARLMQWWDGRGAARVLAHDDDAILLERAQNAPSLVQLVHRGSDDEASLIICETVAALHAPRAGVPPPLVPLDHWFDALRPAAETHGGVLQVAAAVAAKLLAEQREICALHGDIHHGNILNFGPRGWLAIDPKGLIGMLALSIEGAGLPGNSSSVVEPRRKPGALIFYSGESGEVFTPG